MTRATEDPSEAMRAGDVDEVDPESARLLHVDAADQLAALGVDREDGLALAKQYLAERGDGDVEGFVAYVRRSLESIETTPSP